ncbi:MAG: mechanosensitive ion channel family protein [Planctomycetota bacterium]|nr:MAG: mechanosensitive ion channel family protein [Planctomycetota bacterium]
MMHYAQRFAAACPLILLPIAASAEEENSFAATLDVAYKWMLVKGSAVVVTIVVGVLVWLVIKNLIHRLFERTNMVPVFAAFVQRGLRWIMVLIISLAVMQQIGVELGMLWGLLSAGLAMVAIGFVAVWSILSNSTAAFILLMARPFRIGDTIEVTEATGGGSLRGLLTDVSLVYTTIEEQGPDGLTHQVRIPNNVLLQKTIRVIPATNGGIDLGAHLSENMMAKPDRENLMDIATSASGD